MPPFQPGQPKPPGSGRQKGQVGVRTELARAGVKSAIDICRTGGDDPISIMVNAARFLNTVAAAYAPRTPQNATQQEIATAIKAVGVKDLEFMRKFLVDAATIAQKAAEFGYAKLQRIDYVGDIPQAPQTVENRFLFVLNVDSGARPGRPVVINGDGSESDDEPAAAEHSHHDD